ncbi:hypothetical protein [Caulobacter sp. LARHSG274]
MTEDAANPSQPAPKTNEPAPSRDDKVPPSPNEGRLGPAADPAEGKRD